MKKFVYNIFALLVLGVIIFFFHERITANFLQIKGQFFPCASPIAYSIGTFDDRFGISKEEFIKDIADAEAVWEKPVGKELLVYKEGEGSLKINLIYDSRQESTVQLKKIGSVLDNSKASYDSLKAKFNSLKSEYENGKKVFNDAVSVLETRKYKYEQEVKYLNSIGGANEEQFKDLENEKTYLRKEVQRINQMQAELNAKAKEVNALVAELNSLAKSLNLNVKKFNEVGSSNGEEFEEGVYETGPTGNKINVYQFENQAKLVRVLAHEFGHALGINHIENPEAIMYRLNSGKGKELTQDDIAELNKKCDSKNILE